MISLHALPSTDFPAGATVASSHPVAAYGKETVKGLKNFFESEK
jgi:hypothetical protein